MISRVLRKTVLLGGMLLLSVLLVGQSASPPGVRLNITEVFVDAPVAGQITILGENFLFGGFPAVTLGNFGSLTFVGKPTNNQIVAALPPGIPAGDYLLTVSSSTGETEYDLTIGAVGVSGWEKRLSATVNCGPSPCTNVTTASCSAGKKVLGGGFFNSSSPPSVCVFLTTVDRSYPDTDTSWTIRVSVTGTDNDPTLCGLASQAFVICGFVP